MSARHSDAEAVEAQHLATLGPELGPVFHCLHNEVAWLYIKWEQFRALYGTSRERVELLNASAALLFRVLHDTMWKDVLVHLCRLTDPPKVGKKLNLSITRLPGLIDDPTLRDTVKQLVESAIHSAAFARDWRNRNIAHRDLALALRQSTQPLEEATRAKIGASAMAIARCLNCISLGYMNSTCGYEEVHHPGDATDLLYLLDDGIRAGEARRERASKGLLLPEDYIQRSV